MMRRAAKVDGNQQAIVDDLRRIPGCSVLVLSAVGRGCPDLLVGYRGANLLVELKLPKLTGGAKAEVVERQQAFHDAWTGYIVRATSFHDIVKFLIGQYSEELAPELAGLLREAS